MPTDFTPIQLLLIAVIFVWAGFVRSGLGFGGAALGLPLMLFIENQPIYWLPIIGIHLLFFTSITLRTRLQQVDWTYLRRSSPYIIPGALAGVFGLLTFPNQWLVTIVYSVTLFYASLWLMNWSITSHNVLLDKLLLLLGGYIAGTSLSGAPLIVAVYMRYVATRHLRNTLFVLWFVLVTIKMSAFVIVGVDLHFVAALLLLPIAAIGHIIGLRLHDRIMQSDHKFRRFIGGALFIICLLGLSQR